MFKLLLPLILFPLICTAQDSSFHKAMASYKSKNYTEAIQLFDKALAEHPDQPEILFNLGLAWKNADNEAMAIGLWRKALAIDPYFSKAKEALTFVQKITPQHNSAWENYRANFLKIFPFNLSLALLSLFIALFGFSLINYLGQRKKARDDEFSDPPSLPIKTIGLGLLLILILTISLTKALDHFEKRGTLIKPNTALLVSPDEKSLELLKVQAGLEVILRKKFNTWVQIKVPGGPAGWVKAEELLQTHGRQL